MASLNTLNLENRFSGKDHLIICISRTYGCGGQQRLALPWQTACGLTIMTRRFFCGIKTPGGRKKIMYERLKAAIRAKKWIRPIKGSGFPLEAAEDDLKDFGLRFSRYHGQ